MSPVVFRREVRAVPARFWLAAGLWGLTSWVLSAPFATWGARGFAWGEAQFAGSTVDVVTLLGALGPAVALFRVWPAVALAATTVGLSLLAPTDAGVYISYGSYAALVGVAFCAMWRHQRAAWAIALASLTLPLLMSWTAGGVMLVIPALDLDIRSDTWGLAQLVLVPLLYAMATVLVMGTALSLRIGAAQAAEQAALVAQRTKVENRATAVDERARLVRDLHDVVTHRISLIAVRAETAPYLQPDLDENTKAVLADVAHDARAAMDEMRDLLGVLHRTTDPAARSPQPGMEGITQLVADAQAAGAEVHVIGSPPTMSEAVGNTAYRVLQEALTNARRHDHAGPTTVQWAMTGQDGILLRVTNPVGPGIPDGAVAPGRGLSGMRERVELVGGTLNVGVHNGHFKVEATMRRSARD